MKIKKVYSSFVKTGSFIAALATTFPVAAQLNSNCVVSVLNRNVQVNADGTWVLPNIPANFGRVRARATCVENGVTTFGESNYFTVPANGSVTLPPIALGSTTSIPTSLTISVPNVQLNTAGATVQLGVVATYPNGQSADVTASNAGTNYSVSNAAIATISPEGLVTALRSGTVMVQATNEGTQAIRSISIAFGSDSDGDGIPDDAEIALGLNPNNSADGLLDLDHDGLTNLEEFQAGTQIWNSDTDGDGFTDSEEVRCTSGPCMNALLADTNGDVGFDREKLLRGEA